MLRHLATLALAAILSLGPAVADATDRKPLVQIDGQLRQIPTGDTVPLANGGTGATTADGARTKLGLPIGTMSVISYGAIPDDLLDDTLAIQTAINSGNDLVFPAGTYLASNLTQTADSQRFYGEGAAIIQKNANGDLFTSSGDKVEIDGLQFWGDASTPSYTGDNIVSSGDHFHLINCGSRWAYGRAVKATGQATHIIGTNDLYQTTDATASGWDIELGVSGTATLYHQIIGVYTSQATGGVLLVDTGGVAIIGGQFGKLKIDSGTGPAGTNGGMTVGARILGAVTVELSSAIFTGNQFGDVAITLASGTSGIRLDKTNTFGSSATVVNSGNGNNLIETQRSSGTFPTLRYGADASYTEVSYVAGEGLRLSGQLQLANNKGYYARNAADDGNLLLLLANASNNVTVGHGGGSTNMMLNAGAGGGYLAVAGTSYVQWTTAAIRPQTTGTITLGTASQAFGAAHVASVSVGGNQVVGARGAAVADATDAASVITQLNALLARLRTHGLIAP